ncbi:MAG: helix-turn-helix domain-containing protein [Crocosphaera sp.]
MQRLNGIRRALLLADPKINTVKNIAYNWGFWHLGHFSVDYKKMFGETPAQTLRLNLY